MPRPRHEVARGFRFGLGVWLAALAVASLLAVGVALAWWYLNRGHP